MTSTSGARERRSARARGEHALCAGTCARRKRLSLRAGRALTKRALAREEVSRPLPRPCTKGLRRERGRTLVPATQRDRQSRHFRLGGGSRGMDTASSRLSRRYSRTNSRDAKRWPGKRVKGWAGGGAYRRSQSMVRKQLALVGVLIWSLTSRNRLRTKQARSRGQAWSRRRACRRRAGARMQQSGGRPAGAAKGRGEDPPSSAFERSSERALR